MWPPFFPFPTEKQIPKQMSKNAPKRYPFPLFFFHSHLLQFLGGSHSRLVWPVSKAILQSLFFQPTLGSGGGVGVIPIRSKGSCPPISGMHFGYCSELSAVAFFCVVGPPLLSACLSLNSSRVSCQVSFPLSFVVAFATRRARPPTLGGSRAFLRPQSLRVLCVVSG